MIGRTSVPRSRGSGPTAPRTTTPPGTRVPKLNSRACRASEKRPSREASSKAVSTPRARGHRDRQREQGQRHSPPSPSTTTTRASRKVSRRRTHDAFTAYKLKSDTARSRPRTSRTPGPSQASSAAPATPERRPTASCRPVADPPDARAATRTRHGHFGRRRSSADRTDAGPQRRPRRRARSVFPGRRCGLRFERARPAHPACGRDRVRAADPAARQSAEPRRNDAATILDRPMDETTEAFARLRANFDFTNQRSRRKVVMVTSAGPSEGKSTTVTNLAIALARTGRHVVIVDLDLRRPVITRLLQLPDGPGITDLASRKAELAGVLQPVDIVPLRARVPDRLPGRVGPGRLEVVGSGPYAGGSLGLRGEPGLTEALRKLRAMPRSSSSTRRQSWRREMPWRSRARSTR